MTGASAIAGCSTGTLVKRILQVEHGCALPVRYAGCRERAAKTRVRAVARAANTFAARTTHALVVSSTRIERLLREALTRAITRCFPLALTRPCCARARDSTEPVLDPRSCLRAREANSVTPLRAAHSVATELRWAIAVRRARASDRLSARARAVTHHGIGAFFIGIAARDHRRALAVR